MGSAPRCGRCRSVGNPSASPIGGAAGRGHYSLWFAAPGACRYHACGCHRGVGGAGGCRMADASGCSTRGECETATVGVCDGALLGRTWVVICGQRVTTAQRQGACQMGRSADALCAGSERDDRAMEEGSSVRLLGHRCSGCHTWHLSVFVSSRARGVHSVRPLYASFWYV